MSYAQKLDFDDTLSRRDRAFVDFDFLKRDFRLGKLRTSQLLALPGMSFTGGAGFKTALDRDGNVVGPFAANDPGLTNRGFGGWRAATNTLINSRAFAGSGWTTSATVPSAVTDNYALGPDGTMTAARFVPGVDGNPPQTIAAGSNRLWQPQGGANGQYAHSIWVKHNGTPGLAAVYVINNTSDTALGSKQVPTTSDWQRITAVGTTNGTPTGSRFLFSAEHECLIWNGQAEPGGAATPDIVTGASAATRTADNLRLGLGRLPVGAEIHVEVEWEVAATEFITVAAQVQNAATAPTAFNTWFIGRNGSGTPNSNPIGSTGNGMANYGGSGPLTTPGTIIRASGSVSLSDVPCVAYNGQFMVGSTGADILAGVNQVCLGGNNSIGVAPVSGYLRRFIMSLHRAGNGYDLAHSRL